MDKPVGDNDFFTRRKKRPAVCPTMQTTTRAGKWRLGLHRRTEIELFSQLAETGCLGRRALDLPQAASRKPLFAKVRSFIDFVAEHFAMQDDERTWTGFFGVS